MHTSSFLPSCLRLGTRGSHLALKQASMVKQQLLALYPDIDITVIPIQTTGDRLSNQDLSTIGGKGLFIKEIEEQLLDGTIDLAVHSLKDMPAVLPDSLEIISVLLREDPRDALLSYDGNTLQSLPPHATLGTSSPRRASQILHLRPDIRIAPFRGNVPTRIRKFQEQSPVSTTVLAMAGLNRLDMYDPDYMHPLSPEDMLPAVAQGAIGIEIHKDNHSVCSLIAPLNHTASSVCVQAERLFLGYFEQASCRTPIAAYANYVSPEHIAFSGLIATPDGTRLYRKTSQGSETDLPHIATSIARALAAEAGEHFFGT